MNEGIESHPKTRGYAVKGGGLLLEVIQQNNSSRCACPLPGNSEITKSLNFQRRGHQSEASKEKIKRLIKMECKFLVTMD